MSSQASNKIKELLWEKIVDGNNDVFKIALMADGFSFSPSTHSLYGDVSAQEVVGGSGYITGGNTLSGVTITKDDTEGAGIIAWNNSAWTMAGADLNTVGAIIYDDTVASPVKPIVGYIDFGGLLTTYDTGVFTVANIAIAIL